MVHPHHILDVTIFMAMRRQDHWRRFKKTVKTPHGALGLFLLVLVVSAPFTWWYFGPVFSAQYALHSLNSGNQEAFEEIIEPSYVIESFMNEWMYFYRESTPDPIPLALILSVKQDAVSRMHSVYLREIIKSRRTDYSPLYPVELKVGWKQRFSVGTRDVLIVAESPQGTAATAWLKMRRSGLIKWKAHEISGLTRLLDFALSPSITGSGVHQVISPPTTDQ